MLTSDGRVLRFGGEVMKNVAGCDVARVLAGSLGILGVILDASLKVLPLRPTLTLKISCDGPRRTRYARSRRVISDADHGELSGARIELYVRLEGSACALNEIVPTLGGDIVSADVADAFWRDVRDQRHDFFARATRELWRVNVPSRAPLIAPAAADVLLEWNGCPALVRGIPPRRSSPTLRAPVADSPRCSVRRRIDAGSSAEVFAPLPAPVMALHRSFEARLRSGWHPEPGPHVRRTLNRPMHTETAATLADTALAAEAKALIRSCVHCGFCLPALSDLSHHRQ
jgi:glycolate oxidase FAD binding subunit